MYTKTYFARSTIPLFPTVTSLAILYLAQEDSHCFSTAGKYGGDNHFLPVNVGSSHPSTMRAHLSLSTSIETAREHTAPPFMPCR